MSNKVRLTTSKIGYLVPGMHKQQDAKEWAIKCCAEELGKELVKTVMHYGGTATVEITTETGASPFHAEDDEATIQVTMEALVTILAGG